MCLGNSGHHDSGTLHHLHSIWLDRKVYHLPERGERETEEQIDGRDGKETGEGFY